MTAATNTAPPSAGGLTVLQGATLVAKREIISTARTKAFIWSFAITLVIIALLIVGQKWLGEVFTSAAGVSTDTKIATTLPTDEFAAAGLDAVEASSADDAVDMLRSGDATAVVVPGTDAAGMELYGMDGDIVKITGEEPIVVISQDEIPSGVLDALTITPVGGMIDKPASELPPMVTYFLGLAFGMVFMTGVLGYAQRIAQTVVEEKASRIVELLLVTVSPRTILAGKVIGGTILAVVQVASIVLVAVACLAVTGQLGDFGGLIPALVWFGVLFIFGFMLFAALYASVASTVSRPEDVPNATMVLTFVAMAPYILVIMFNTNQTVLTWLSYIPLSSPVAMPLRITAGTAQWWEPFVALIVLILTTVACLALGAKIYENTVLRTGRVKLTEALKSA